MKEIKLTQGEVAFVDDSDYESLNKFKWYAGKDRNYFYACRAIPINGKQKIVKMQWEIMGEKWIDHIDRNGLNNQKSNLRVCTRNENSFNTRKQENTSSKFKGVSLSKSQKCRKWMSRITINKKLIYIGLFEDEVEAAKAYNKKAIEHFGSFANLNII